MSCPYVLCSVCKLTGTLQRCLCLKWPPGFNLVTMTSRLGGDNFAQADLGYGRVHGGFVFRC